MSDEDDVDGGDAAPRFSLGAARLGPAPASLYRQSVPMNVLQNAAWMVAIVGGGGLVAWLAGARSRLGAIHRRRREHGLRTWHGYIPRGMIASWYVHVVEEPTAPTARVVLEVRQGGPDGKLDVTGAHMLRQHIRADGMLARVPTPAEYGFLGDLEKERGYGHDPDAQAVH